MSEPFTLRVFVPSGDPEGTRIIDRMNWTGRAYYVPREDWPTVRNRTELVAPGVYILIGSEEDELGNEFPIVYIGQAEDIRTRIDQHDAKKEFWDKAMFFLSANGGLNRAHILWLEWSLMKKADEAKRSKLDNGLTHTEPMLSESEKADTRAFLNEILRLMPVMGIHIFEVGKAMVPSHNAIIKTVQSEPVLPDVIVVPAKLEGFQSAFINSNAWWAIRIGAKHLPNLKWIAAYQVAPICAVTHIAEIDRFEPYGDDGKYKVVFKGSAKELESPIPFANAVSGAMQGPRYCTKTVLDNAATVADIVR